MIHKNTKILMGMILLIGIVSAGVLSITLTKVTLDAPTEKVQEEIKNISVLCDKEWIEVENIETDLDEGDLIALARHSKCEFPITEFKDWNGDVLYVNEFGMISGDQDALKEDECIKDGNVWEDGVCTEPVAEPVGGEEI